MDKTRAGVRCRVLKNIATRDGLLRRDTCGTIQYETENLGRLLVYVKWDNDTEGFVFPDDIEVSNG